MMTSTSAPARRSGGLLGDPGYQTALAWTAPREAGQLAARLAAHGQGEVTRNPHLAHAWAREAVTSPVLLARLKTLIGADIAVENSFLIIKQPGTAFAVPAHQDGINDRIVLDPARAVAVWLAVTDATTVNGCLEIIPGSQRGGYLPFHRAEVATPASGQRPLTTAGDFTESAFVPVPVPGGQACLMDTRLVHRSGPNQSRWPRAGLNVRYVAPGAVTVRDGSAVDLFTVTGTRW
jgi:ectoine hydroxylase-related dioxygenase (phytanoyl-CoA dioxygenase family)